MSNKIKNIGITFKATAIFFLVHIALGAIGSKYGMVMGLQGAIVLILGFRGALKKNKMMVFCAITYIAGAEILWRVTSAPLFWEFGKYAVSAICFTYVIMGREKGRPTTLLIVYLLCLLPAIFWAPHEEFNELRKTISFNMSGPISIVACGLAFSRMTFSRDELQRGLIYFLGPIASIAFIVLTGIRQTKDIVWGTVSSFVASGGFGPNQVSTALAMGAVFCVIIILLQKNKVNFKVMILALSFWFFSQAVLTFSRGGVVQAVITLGAFFIILFKEKGTKFISLAFFALFLMLIGIHYVLPKLDAFTQGALSKRYEEKEKIGGVEVYTTTGRTEIIQSDIRAFLNNPLGVGVGGSEFWHEKDIGESVIAHTEWSRLLAEHGILGLISIIALLAWMKRGCDRQREGFFQALFFSFGVSASFYMCHVGMRTVLPGLLIGFLGSGFKKSEV